MVLGIIGLMIPIIPQVPFLIAALLLFAGAMPGVKKWMVSTGVFKKYALPHIQKNKTLRKLLLEE